VSSIDNYSWIVFDADDTLFHFDALRGLKHLFAPYNIMFSEDDYTEYELVNKPLWVDYQNGLIGAEQLQHRRFEHWANRLNCKPQDLNDSYMSIMAEICTPIEGAVALLNALKEKVRMGIITNGFTRMQHERLERTQLTEYFDILVISEQVGKAKPHQAIFDHTLALMGNPSPSRVLMVGDNPDSDILGGMSVGFQTCWFNQYNK
jgi:5'-nucleotidase